jgi:hypothetical protein
MSEIIDLGKEKYLRNVNKEDYVKGVNATKEAPGKLAADHKDKFVSNTSNKEAKLAAALDKVDEGARKQANKDAIPKAIVKITASVNNGTYPAATILAAGKEAHNECKKMPNTTLDDSYNRMMKNQTIQTQKHGGKK